VDAALSGGWRVRVLDNLTTGTVENLAHVLPEIDLIRGDIRDAEIVDRAVAGCEIVFHQAGVSSVPGSFADPNTSYRVNAEGTLHVLTSARRHGVRRVLLASSSSVYGRQRHLPLHENLPPRPISPYGASKLSAEALALALCSSGEPDTVALRYFNVYGPRQRTSGPRLALVPAAITRLLEDRAPVVYGDGSQTRDFTFVSDVVAANMRAATSPSLVSGVYNVGSGMACAVLDVIRLLASLLDRPSLVTHQPARQGDIRHTRADLTLAREVFGYRPAHDLRSGLTACVRPMAHAQSIFAGAKRDSG
jgi:UDP-glucose 4-epimerase